jgi:hypothetical protein
MRLSRIAPVVLVVPLLTEDLDPMSGRTPPVGLTAPVVLVLPMLAEDLDPMSGRTPPVGLTAPVVLVVPMLAEDLDPTGDRVVRAGRMDLGLTAGRMVRMDHMPVRPSRKEDLDHMAKQISTTRIDSAGLSAAAC